eukprot:TRINITY_DN927_c1_g1_i1.p1 TRINITY_DN927_c1_g1~~TRINITY_DN927_c1_g1_i1.p1  ORF type:complete len:1209 (+),score=292.25 TRINITY_DN927_c1_g1_i1:54-3629(+)
MRSSDMSWLLLMSSLCTVSTAQFTWVPVAGTSCLDGSTAGYYKSAGSAASSMWVVGAGGGEPCGFPAAKGEDCRDQTRGIAGSSKSFPATVASEQQLPNYNPYEVLVMSNVEALNERFHQANKVWIPHCSGDMHIGRLTKPTPVSHGMKFSGATNMELILQALNATTELGTGDDLLFTGSGVGGYAVLQHCDYAAGVFSGSSVACVPVDGFIFPSLDLTNMSVFWAPPSDYASFVTAGQDPDPSRFFSLLVLWQAKVHAGCAGALAAQGPLGGACLSMATVMATDPNAFADARVRLFIVQNRYDGLQLTLNGLTGNVSAGTNYINYYGERMAATLQSPNVSSHGLFLTSCYSHIAGVSAAAGAGVPAAMPLFTVDGVNAAKAVADWYFNVASSVSHRHIHSCTTVSCDSTCVIPIPTGTVPPTPEPSPQVLANENVGLYTQGPKDSDEWMGVVIAGSIIGFTALLTPLVVFGSSKKLSLSCGYCCGIMMISLSLLMWGLVPLILGNVLHDGLTLDTNDAEQMFKFGTTKRNDTAIMYRDYYAFNITNVFEVMAGTEHPKLEEVGPFVYEYHTESVNITVLNNGTKVSYVDVTSYKFIPERSVQDESEKNLYVFNGPYAGLIAGFAQLLNVAGEGEIQMAMPSFVYEAAIKVAGPATSTLWATDPVNLDAGFAQYLKLPALPFFMSFAAYTASTGTNYRLDAAEAELFFQKVRFGTTGANAPNLIAIVGALNALDECIKTTCEARVALHGVLGAFGIPFLNNETLTADLVGYFHQITYDTNFPTRVGALTALTHNDGWFHRSITKVPAKEVWFRNNDPLYTVLRGSYYPGAFYNWYSVQEALAFFEASGEDRESIMHTGKDDWRKRGFFEKDYGRAAETIWDYKFNLTKAGTRYTPEISYSHNIVPGEPDSVSLWVQLIHRDVSFLRGGTVSVKGVELRKYYLNQNLIGVDSGFNNELYGFINMAPHFGVPTFYSAPHFSYAFNNSEELTSRVEGLVRDENPDPVGDSNHTSIVYFEPITGIVMKAERRLQANFHINNKGGVHFPVSFPNIGNSPVGTMMPILWADQYIELTDSDADDVKNKLYALVKMRLGLCIVFWLLGPAALAVTIFFFYKHKKMESSECKYSNGREAESDSDEPRSPDRLIKNGGERPSCPVIPFHEGAGQRGAPALATFAPVDTEMAQKESGLPGQV